MKFWIFLLILAVAGVIYFTSSSSDSKENGKAEPAAAPAAAVAAYPQAVTKSLKKAEAHPCLHNLKQIGLAFQSFAMDNNDRLPAANGVKGFEELISSQHLPTAIFCCPQNRPAQLTEAECAFLYLGGCAVFFRDRLPLAIEKPGRHGNMAAVLYTDNTTATVAIPGEYTSVSQVISQIIPPGNLQEKYLEAVKAVEK